MSDGVKVSILMLNAVAFAYYIGFYLNSRLPSVQNRIKALMVWILFLEHESQKHQKYPFLIQFTNTLDTFTYRNTLTLPFRLLDRS